jgi:hypothetical protein
VQVFIERRRLSMRCVPAASSDVVEFDFEFQTNRWYCIALVHTNHIAPLQQHQQQSNGASPGFVPSLHERGAAQLFIDGMFWQSADVEYPHWDGSTQAGVDSTIGGFAGGMGPFYLFHEALTARHAQSIAAASAHHHPALSHQFATVPPTFASASASSGSDYVDAFQAFRGAQTSVTPITASSSSSAASAVETGRTVTASGQVLFFSPAAIRRRTEPRAQRYGRWSQRCRGQSQSCSNQ